MIIIFHGSGILTKQKKCGKKTETNVSCFSFDKIPPNVMADGKSRKNTTYLMVFLYKTRIINE